MMILVIKLFIDNWITLGLAREGRAVFYCLFAAKNKKITLIKNIMYGNSSQPPFWYSMVV